MKTALRHPLGGRQRGATALLIVLALAAALGLQMAYYEHASQNAQGALKRDVLSRRLRSANMSAVSVLSGLLAHTVQIYGCSQIDEWTCPVLGTDPYVGTPKIAVLRSGDAWSNFWTFNASQQSLMVKVPFIERPNAARLATLFARDPSAYLTGLSTSELTDVKVQILNYEYDPDVATDLRFMNVEASSSRDGKTMTTRARIELPPPPPPAITVRVERVSDGQQTFNVGDSVQVVVTFNGLAIGGFVEFPLDPGLSTGFSTSILNRFYDKKDVWRSNPIQVTRTAADNGKPFLSVALKATGPTQRRADNPVFYTAIYGDGTQLPPSTYPWPQYLGGSAVPTPAPTASPGPTPGPTATPPPVQLECTLSASPPSVTADGSITFTLYPKGNPTSQEIGGIPGASLTIGPFGATGIFYMNAVVKRSSDGQISTCSAQYSVSIPEECTQESCAYDHTGAYYCTKPAGSWSPTTGCCWNIVYASGPTMSRCDQ